MATLNVTNEATRPMAFQTKTGLVVVAAGDAATIEDARPLDAKKVEYLAALGCEVETGSGKPKAEAPKASAPKAKAAKNDDK